MKKAADHAVTHGARQKPALSPLYTTVLNGDVDVPALHSMGVRVVVWTPNDEAAMRELMEKCRVDGIISDEPEMLMRVVNEMRAKHKGDAAWMKYLDAFESSAHRGGRSDRPENTLPSFENGIDSGVNTIETDTGVTTDGVSAIWHEEYYHPESCRKADGSAYTTENIVWIHDLSMPEAAKMFICDKARYAKATGKKNEEFSGHQTNDLSLSPVSVAFAKKEGMASPYSPTNAAQLLRFVKFYTQYYSTGAGRKSPMAKARAANGARVHVSLETKINAPETIKHANSTPEEFVKALGGAIASEGMELRTEVQSFYFPTMLGFQEKFPKIPTNYLTGSEKQLRAKSMPAQLKVD